MGSCKEPEVRALDLSLAAALFDDAPFAVVLEDDHARVAWCNASVEQMCAGSPARWAGRPVAELLAACPVGIRATRIPLATEGSGAAVTYLLAAEPDAGVRPSLQRLLDNRPGVDPATGMLDEATVQRVLQGEVTRTRRYGNPLSVVLMRLRERGEREPAEVMSDVARALREQLRWADIVGRLSEWEFLLVLPETESAGIDGLIDKVAAALAGGADGGYRAEFAFADWQRGDDATRLLERVITKLDAAA